MLTTPHVLTGIAIANAVGNPWLAAPLSMISHQVIDLIPHDDFLDDKETGELDVKLFKDGKLRINYKQIIIAADFAIAMTAAIYFGIHFGNLPLYLLCSVLAIWSDLLRIPMFFFGDKSKFSKLIDKIDSEIFHSNENSLWGKAVQIAVIVNALAILFRKFPWLE